jgi:DNA-binding CsgD family transcriptional regulator
MPAQVSVRKDKRAANNDMVVVESLANLLQTIAENPTSSNGFSSLPQQGSEAEEILVDVELDGTRYLLMRLPRSEERIQLSPREQEIVRMVAGGHPNKIIASVLNISSWTVCTYLRRIFAKLHVNSRAAMVARASELGCMREYPSPKLCNRSNASETLSLNPNLSVSNIPASGSRMSPHQTLARHSPPQKAARSNVK